MKASIIICTYNRASLLKESIDSVLKQNFPCRQYEIIVVDNNSTDNTRQLVETMAGFSPVSLKYVFEKTQGLSHARNTGIKHSQGDIVVFTDDDIEADKSWLKELLGVFDHPDVACAGGPIRPIWLGEKPSWLTERLQVFLTIYEYEEARQTGEIKGPCYPAGANIAFRKNIFEIIGMFPTNLGRVGGSLLSNEESLLCANIEVNGKRIRFAPQAIIYHKIPPERLRKIFFYHRMYWQGRSNAILDMHLKMDSRLQLRKYVYELIVEYRDKSASSFSRSCQLRLIKGYLIEILSNKVTANTSRQQKIMLCLLNTIIKALEESPHQNTDYTINNIMGELKAIRTSYSWRITAPIRKFCDKVKLIKKHVGLKSNTANIINRNVHTDIVDDSDSIAIDKPTIVNIEDAKEQLLPPCELPQICVNDFFGRDKEFTLLDLEPIDGNISLLEMAAITRLVKRLSPNKIFEIGTFDGRTALNMIANSPSNCQLITLDLPAEMLSGTKLSVEHEDVKYINKKMSGTRFIGTEYADRIMQLYGDSAAFDFTPYIDQIDLVFVDGSHSYDYVVNDTQVALKLLKSTGGVLIYHDYNTPWWPGVTRALNELYSHGGIFSGLINIQGTSLAYLLYDGKCGVK